MLTTLIASAMMGEGFAFTEIPDPTGPMEISNLQIATTQEGVCGEEVPTTSAEIELSLVTVNRDDDAYYIKVYLSDQDNPFGIFGAMDDDDSVFGGTGVFPLFPGWSQGFGSGDDVHRWHGRWTLTGEVENGTFNRHTTHWRFSVKLFRSSDDEVVQTLTIDWSKTYGTCS